MYIREAEKSIFLTPLPRILIINQHIYEEKRGGKIGKKTNIISYIFNSFYLN